MHPPPLVIVTPALAASNNGNWQTAARWARMLRPAYRVHITDRWSAGDEALMIALHARRSAPSVAAWRETHPERPLVLVLTGTDLYRDIHTEEPARRSLELADALVTLNEWGPRSLPEGLRSRGHVVLQSCLARTPQVRPRRHLRVLMVGHLREEKDPRTYWRAAQRLAARQDIRFDHIGTALDPVLGAELATLQARMRGLRWLGGLPHAATRRRIASAHVLVHASRMEGGAHVIIEAIRSGTPVLASRIDGNLGLLGGDYEGVFDVGDADGLACLLERCRDDPDMLPRLASRLALRSPLFEPAVELRAVQELVGGLLRHAGRRRLADG